MADFKTALEALTSGQLDLDGLTLQLTKLLNDNPKYATRLLAQLEKINETGNLDNQSYTELKRQINEFRRTHSSETENVDTPADPESTKFAQEDQQIEGADSEDATEIKEVNEAELARDLNALGFDSEDSTEIKSIAEIDSEDSTEINDRAQSGAEESTQIMEGGDSGSSVDFDISMGLTDSSDTGTGGPTGAHYEEPVAQGDYIEGRDLDVGDVIKHRFKLLGVLGIGGMGKVFKGIDLLKEEAQDKNPYMAIKLLNEDFKSHPEAFISLQRESSRQQKLAHPNIATVYDFDRIGGKGTPVFITMELMVGQPLNTYIKKVVKKQGGLPFKEAFRMVKALGSALEYAHDRRLVHSDFKPGNAFLCDDGTVKTLDFGIARAVKNPLTGEAEATLFDPGKLGALTPAYASLEMLEGEEPDTRDDTYALGCVAYELLTGKHPFNKLPATTARDNGLVAPTVKGLNKKQNRALKRCVAFTRDDRPQTVPDFIEEFEGLPTWHKHPATWAAGVLLLIGIVMINPALDYLHQQKVDGLIAEINSGGNSLIIDKLAEIRTYEPADQTAITSQSQAAIQRYFSTEIARSIDVNSDSYNFPQATIILTEAQEFYPESVFIQQQQDDIEFNKKQKISELYQQFIAALDPTQALENPDSIDGTKAVLEIIRLQIDPQHPLLTDARPSNAYRLAANLAFENGDLDQALTFVSSGLQNSSDDPLLTDMQIKVRSAIRVVEISDTLSNAQEQLVSLENYQQYQSEIVELAGLSNSDDSPMLLTMANGLESMVAEEYTRIINEGDRAEAQTLANEIQSLLTALSLSDQLTQIKLAHLSGDERTAAIQEMVANDLSTLEASLANPQIENTQWEADVVASVRELDALIDEDSTITEQLDVIKESLAALYIDSASSTLNANRFDAAENLISRGLRFAPDLTSLNDTQNMIISSRQTYEQQVRVSGLKDQFQVAVEADNITEANQIFDTLKTELPEDDIYIVTQAPRELAESYRRLAERRAESNEFESAFQLAEAAINLNPRDPTLQGIFEEYRARVNITELADVFRNARIFTDDERIDLSRKVSEVERGAPGQYSDFLSQSETLISERISFLAQSDENSAAALADTMSRIFTSSSVLADLRNRYQLQPWPERNTAEVSIRGYELTKATELLQTAMTGEYSDHPDVLQYQKAVDQSINNARESYEVYLAAKAAADNEYGKLNQAKRLLYRAQAFWIDNPEYTEAETDIDTLIADAPDNPAKRIVAREQAVDFNAAPTTVAQDWKPIPSDRACTSDKASYGSRARAICYDFVNTGWRGPQMVVVPAGESVANTFAIGKYEVSVADWSKYCALTGKCQPITDRSKFDDPITEISLADAQLYVDWLSERTGKTYRIPNADEWEYAASVGGTLTGEADAFRDIKGQLNCRVTLGDKILKGTGIATIKSGRPNKWGIYNFVVNVQEWVSEGSSTSARGGAFSDAINNCDITTVRPHDGNADGITGFRVILEEMG
ncbi:MAG: serine/threonine protein kinase [Gammaproteobacteria bacterium]|jgi:serine/threonine protein kinase